MCKRVSLCVQWSGNHEMYRKERCKFPSALHKESRKARPTNKRPSASSLARLQYIDAPSFGGICEPVDLVGLKVCLDSRITYSRRFMNAFWASKRLK
jgi:hypothetical protein